MIDWFAAADQLSGNTVQRTPTLPPELSPYWDRYLEIQDIMRPLRIQVEIQGVMAGYHPLTLDGLLARLVVDEAFQGEQLDNSATPYLLPGPLKLAWRHPVTTLPLWSANWFAPVTADREVSIWWHKRFIREDHVDAARKMNRGEINASAGRFKEKRIPMPAHIASVWQADCVGDADEIARLLTNCRTLSKKRSALVVEWRISPIDEFVFVRPVPVEFAGIQEAASLNMRYCGWTPPYWASIPEVQGWCTDVGTF